MTKTKDLSELADEYYSAADSETELIGKNREKLRECKKARNLKEVSRLKALICLLYRQKRELLETANYLKNYYRSSGIHPAQKKVYLI